jgi:putative phage-type endonuclease
VTLTAAQLEQRRSGLGGSEIGAVAGLDPFKGAMDVWLEKTGQAPPSKDSEPASWGRRLEAAIAEEYAEREGVELVPSDTLRHPRESWMVATPDRLVRDPGRRPFRGLECKNRGVAAAKYFGDAESDEVPPAVYAQCAWYMAVTDLPRWDVAVLFGGNTLRIYRLERDRKIEAGLIEKGRRFWHDHVLAGVAPLDGSRAAHGYLARTYRGHDGLMLWCGPETPEGHLAMSFYLADLVAKSTKAQADALKAQIKATIGGHRGLEGPWGRITWSDGARQPDDEDDGGRRYFRPRCDSAWIGAWLARQQQQARAHLALVPMTNDVNDDKEGRP